MKYDIIETMMHRERIGGIILVCKSNDLVWSTASAILRLAMTRNGLTETEIKQAQRDSIGLSRAAADRIVRF